MLKKKLLLQAYSLFFDYSLMPSTEALCELLGLYTKVSILSQINSN